MITIGYRIEVKVLYTAFRVIGKIIVVYNESYHYYPGGFK